MSESVCPQCGAEGSGNFCAHCGSSLQTLACPACGHDARPGQRFCTSCGAALGGGGVSPAGAGGAAGASSGGSGGGGDGALGWWIAGLAMVALILFLLVPVLSPDQGRQAPDAGAGRAGASGAPAGGAGQLGPAPNVDLSSMTPREAADRLFDRVMMAVEGGDSAQAQAFLPMAIAAYERARPLDADGLFHLSVLQRTALRFEEALETARGGLEDEPDHLLLLSAAAEAARAMGDTATARTHFSHLLEVYDAEVATDRQDYQAHRQILPRLREDARSFVDGS